MSRRICRPSSPFPRARDGGLVNLPEEKKPSDAFRKLGKSRVGKQRVRQNLNRTRSWSSGHTHAAHRVEEETSEEGLVLTFHVRAGWRSGQCSKLLNFAVETYNGNYTRVRIEF